MTGDHSLISVLSASALLTIVLSIFGLFSTEFDAPLTPIVVLFFYIIGNYYLVKFIERSVSLDFYDRLKEKSKALYYLMSVVLYFGMIFIYLPYAVIYMVVDGVESKIIKDFKKERGDN